VGQYGRITGGGAPPSVHISRLRTTFIDCIMYVERKWLMTCCKVSEWVSDQSRLSCTWHTADQHESTSCKLATTIHYRSLCVCVCVCTASPHTSTLHHHNNFTARRYTMLAQSTACCLSCMWCYTRVVKCMQDREVVTAQHSNDLQSFKVISSFFECDFCTLFCATVDKISTELQRRAAPSALAELVVIVSVARTARTGGF